MEIKTVFTSPLLRALETGALVVNYVGSEVPLEVSDLLREREMGSLEGKTDEALEEDWREDPSVLTRYGTETDDSIRDRVQQFLNALEDGCYVVISHNDVIKNIIAIAKAVPVSQIYGKVKIYAGQLSLLDFGRAPEERLIVAGVDELSL